MGDDKPVTAAEILSSARKRRSLCERVEIDNPTTAAKVLAGFETSMRRRPDLGLSNRVANILLESRNPFEPQRPRKPKMETVIFGTLFALVVAALLFFNVSVPKVQVYP
jgi:hypothetical protein